MQRHFVFLVLAVALLLSACASKAPPSSVPQVDNSPIKGPETTVTQRAQIRTDLAAGYYERGQMDVALEELAEAVKLDPNYARAYNVYGLVYTAMGDAAKAEQNYRRAIALAPADSDIHHNWGVFLCSSGRAREAVAEFETAYRNPLYRTPEIALINAGKCSVSIGDFTRGEQFFRQALTVSPNQPVAAYNLALLAFRQSKLDDARAWMRPVMQQSTPPPEALYLGMCIERKQGDRAAELSYVSQLRNRFPESAEARALPGGACE
jgi:type IV pilus assembly protein PilF